MAVPNEIIQEFLVETHDGLGRVDVELVELEKGDPKPETIASVFRTMHSLKGSAGFLGFQKLESLTHVAESLLSKLRDRKLAVSVPIVSALLASVDAVREILRSVELNGSDGEQTYPDLIARLKALTANEPPPIGNNGRGVELHDPSFVFGNLPLENTQSVHIPAPRSSGAVNTQTPGSVVLDKTQSVQVALPGIQVALPVTTDADLAQTLASVATTQAPQAKARSEQKPPRKRRSKRSSDRQSDPGTEFIVPQPGSSIVMPSFVSGSDLGPQSGSSLFSSQAGTSKVADSTIRLGVERVDKMMNLVTELVLSRNQILQHELVQSSSSLGAAARNLNLITSELQESVMRMRMQPINNVWATLPRVVRDLSLECGKQVRLVLDGAETELDKSVLEAIKDPLMHLVRNAIDHGLETPDVRQSRGKPVEGTLRLRAYHESGHVHIEISDDGAGIDRERVKAKARERELISAEQARVVSDESVLSLIFMPGFSTRDAVSSLSGRGVGMDIVKSNVERIGGLVDIQSTVGVGTTFKLRIPLTLAIIHALMVTSGCERYAIPQTSMIELIRLDGDRMRTGIERIHGTRVHRYRGKLLTLVSLTEVLEASAVASALRSGGEDESRPVAPRQESRESADSQPFLYSKISEAFGIPVAERQGYGNDESVSFVVLQADQQQFGLIVDRVNDTQEIVVKPLHKLLRGISCLAGATILGDGQVALILDVTGLAARALGERQSHVTVTDESKTTTPLTDMQQVVLVGGPRGERLAVPLNTVARMEEFPVTKVEWTGERPVIQYRDEILPLVDVMGMLRRLKSDATENQPTNEPIQVVVCTDGTSRVGLVVGHILDIVTDPLLVRASSAREHVLFTAVVQRRVTEVLNVFSLISSFEAEFLVSGAKA